MSSKKVKRWRSRPSGNRARSDSYRRPQEAGEVYKIARADGATKKEPSELDKRYIEQKQQSAPPAKQRKKKKKYKSKPASSAPPQGYTSYSEKERLRIERTKRCKRNNVLIRASIASVVFVIGIVLSIFIFFKVGRIEVVGNEKYSAAQVIEASGVELGDNLFAPTAAGIQRKFDHSLPYVKSVTLKHELPDGLVICVKEGSAQFAFEVKEKGKKAYIITDEALKYLEKADKQPKGAAVVIGAEIEASEPGETARFKDEEKGELVKTMKAVFFDNKLENVTAINVKSTVDIQVVYAGAITVQIGQAEALDYKCKIAAKAIEDALKENENAKGTVNVKQADQTKQAYFNPAS